MSLILARGLLAAFLAVVGFAAARAQVPESPVWLKLPVTVGNCVKFGSPTGQLVDAATTCGGGVGAPLTNSHIFVGSASNLAADVAVSGDATLANTGALTVTKTNGVAFGAFATGTDAANLTGNIAIARIATALTTPGPIGDATPGTGIFSTTTIGAGAAITSSGAGGALGTNAFTSTTYATLGANTFTGNQTISGAALIFSGNISQAAWTVAGVRQPSVAGTLTDTTSSGTVAIGTSYLYPADTIAASAATTFTNYVNAYYKAPVAGTNVTLTNKYGIGTDSLWIPPLANTPALVISNASHTGSDATSDFSLATTLNNGTNNLDVFSIKATVTGTGSATNLLALYGGVAGTTKEFAVDKAGNVTGTSLALSSGITVGAPNTVIWSGAGYIYGNATTGANTGTMRIQSGSGNPALNFGGDTSSFPSLVRSAASLQFRLADNSADAAISALTVKTFGFTVAGLPTAGTAGRRAYVTDQLTTCAVAGAALTGGGAAVCPVFDNGAAWVGD